METVQRLSHRDPPSTRTVAPAGRHALAPAPRIAMLIGLLLLALASAGCGGGGGQTARSAPVAPHSVPSAKISANTGPGVVIGVATPSTATQSGTSASHVTAPVSTTSLPGAATVTTTAPAETVSVTTTAPATTVTVVSTQTATVSK